MAIKSWDPRKLQDRDIQGNRFDELVVEAWEEAHEAESGPPGHDAGAAGEGGRRRGDTGATHHPFAHLRDQLTRH
ncbi:hypothetical protein [Arhodomonas sp. SL1]|uniref:hypothetical protein n=1 Tax=Arhodomonas sp. SL1 TaxID=3425691 RepID=UPI003F880314